MPSILDYLSGAAGYVPHGYCLLWRPDLVALHAISDLLIGLAYFSIPAVMALFWLRRGDLGHPWVYALFVTFILACGITHFMGLLTLWYPAYGLQGLLKAATALVSVTTAILLWPVLPRALALPSPAELRAANTGLQAEIAQRIAAEEALRRAHDELEERVAARTADLLEANQRLAAEVAERRRVQHGLQRALTRLQLHMTNTPLAVVELEGVDRRLETARITRWSGQAVGIFGWTAEEATGQMMVSLGLIKDAERIERHLMVSELAPGQSNRAVAMLRCRTKNQEVRTCRCHLSIEREAGEGWNVLMLIEDLTERLAAEERVHRLAHHDPLTGLPNRLLFQDRLDRALAHARQEGRKVGLLLLDLDQFKEVNDTLGHPAGDQLLQQTARRLEHLARESDTWARLGGDEFALIQVGIDDEADLQRAANRIITAMEHPFGIESQTVLVTASAGVTLFPDDGDAPERLMRNADMALYRAKAIGRNRFSSYDAAMDREVQSSRSLQRLIRDALDQEAFRLVYQPIIDLQSGRMVQVEALLRLDHPDGGGPVPPNAIIPVAEVTGLIQPLGDWVVRQACRDAARLARAGHTVRVAINLSPAQVRFPDFVGLVERAIAECNLPPQQLEFELTESLFLDPSKQLITDTLASLAALGVTLAIDDFGTGYSSLSYLRHFPFHALKVDGSFVRDIGRNREGESIVLAVVALGRSLGKRVIAECIETREQLEFLKNLHCDLGQGFGIGRPVPLEALRHEAVAIAS